MHSFGILWTTLRLHTIPNLPYMLWEQWFHSIFQIIKEIGMSTSQCSRKDTIFFKYFDPWLIESTEPVDMKDPIHLLLDHILFQTIVLWETNSHHIVHFYKISRKWGTTEWETRSEVAYDWGWERILITKTTWNFWTMDMSENVLFQQLCNFAFWVSGYKSI